MGHLDSKSYSASVLLLAMKIVSPSSARFDRVIKRPLYQGHVPEYCIVDLDSRIIERWQPGDSRPAQNGPLCWTFPRCSERQRVTERAR